MTAAGSVDLYSPAAWLARAATLARDGRLEVYARGCDVPRLLLVQDIALTFGAAPLLSGAGLAVAAGDRICLVGRNGSGKCAIC